MPYEDKNHRTFAEGGRLGAVTGRFDQNVQLNLVRVRSRRPPARLRRFAAPAAIVLAGAFAALLGLSRLSSVGGEVGPGRVEIQAGLQLHGQTDLEVPPLGAVSAATPSAPVRLTARVTAIDLEELQRLATDDRPQARLTGEVRDDLVPLLRWFALRSLLVAVVVGAIVGGLFPHRRWRHAGLGAVGGLLGVGLLLTLTWRSFDVDAFKDARYTGVLEQAPAVVEAVQRHVDGLDAVRDRVEVLARQVSDLYATSAGVGPPIGGGAGETAILHVSDIHLNPLALEVVRQLAISFDVDAVVDTGDLTSFGYSVEARIGGLIEEIPVPYYFVPGNHDSFANRESLAQVPNVRVLMGDAVAEIGPLRVLGVPDPTFTATNETSADEAAAVKREDAPRVRSLVDDLEPDLLAVHDPVLAEASVGHVPVIVAGHRHKRGWVEEKGTLLLTVGTTGASGLGAFTVETGKPYEAQVLRFSGTRLVAVDYITLEGVAGNFTVERRTVAELDLSGEPAARPPEPR